MPPVVRGGPVRHARPGIDHGDGLPVLAVTRAATSRERHAGSPPAANLYYLHSGTFSRTTALAAGSAAVPIAAVVGFGAGVFKVLGDVYIDLGLLGIGIASIIGGTGVAKVVKVAKIRNDRFAFWLGAAAGFAMLVVAWHLHYVFMQVEDMALLGLSNEIHYPWQDFGRFCFLVDRWVHPADERTVTLLAVYASAYFWDGLFAYAEIPAPTGLWSYGVWGIEALILILHTGHTCRRAAGRHGFVFCEDCKMEAKVLYRSPLLQALPRDGGAERDAFRAKLEEGRFEALERLPRAEGEIEPGRFARLVLRGCDTCRNLYCADVAEVEVKLHDRFLVEVDNDDALIVEHLLIPREWYERLGSRFGDATDDPQA